MFLSAVLLLLLAPTVSADENHVDITVISYGTQAAFEEGWNTSPYKDKLNLTYYESGTTDFSEVDLGNPDIIFTYMLWDSVFDEVGDDLERAKSNGAVLIDITSFPGASFNMSDYDYAYPGDENGSMVEKYFYNIGVEEEFLKENSRNFLAYLAQNFSSKTELTADWEYEDPIILPAGLYHPDSPVDKYWFDNNSEYLEWYGNSSNGEHRVYDPDRPTIGIWFHKSDYKDGNTEVVDALIRDLESKDCNVIAGFDTFNNVTEFYCDESGEPLIQCAISLKSFALNYENYTRGIEELEDLDVAVLKGIVASESDDPADANRGIPTEEVARKTMAPDRDGIFEYIVVGKNIQVSWNEYVYEAIPAQVDWIANRSINWAELKLKDNTEKNVAIIYYNYPPGKDNVGASYLDTISSMVSILQKMNESERNYNIEDAPKNSTELLDRIQDRGRNVGSWAPGELEAMVQNGIENGDMVLLPMETYREWFEAEIPEDLREATIAEWGAPWEEDVPSDKSHMIWENESGKYIVIPAVRCGNVWLMPQPARGFMQNENAMYHSSILPPPHQYIAFYLWLNKNEEWKPDALIHLGTHGTHEWLPGSAYGMNRTAEWSPLLLQDIPNIYPYIVANVGEGLTAEYRGNALIIDHLTPTLEKGGLHGEMAGLAGNIQSYYDPAMSGTDVQEKYRKLIIDEMLELKLDVDLDVNESMVEELRTNETFFNDFVKNVLHEYLEEISEENIPYGMHVFGEVPPEKSLEQKEGELVSIIRAIMGASFEGNVTATFYTNARGYPAGIPEGDTDVDRMIREVLINGTEPATAQDIVYGSSNSSVTSDLEFGLSYKDRVVEPVLEDLPPVIRTMLGPSFEGNVTAAFYSNSTLYPAGIPENDTKVDALVRDVIYNGTKYRDAQDALYGFNNSSVNIDLKQGLEYKADILDLHRDEMSLMVRAMMGNSFEKAVEAAFYSDTTEYPLGIPSDDTRVDRLVWEVVSSNSNITPEAAQDLVYGSNESSVSSALEIGVEYRDRLRQCSQEMDHLLSALEGGYIPPRSGRDPIQNPDSVPTGCNFYGVDSRLYPSEAAWELGVAMANSLLEDYYGKYGEYPQKVSFSRFGVEFIRDHGTLEAEVLYLLGIKPIWDDETRQLKVDDEGNFVFAVMNESEMYALLPEDSLLRNESLIGRPRIDIVYTTAGMRDAFPDKIKMIDEAVRLAANQSTVPDTNYTNYVNENSQQIFAALVAAGYDSDTAKQLSEMRCFAVKDGTYEIGVANAIGASGTWENEETIAELYLDKMGYAYGTDIWGEKCSELLAENLKAADASVHSDSSNLYDTLDNDDFFQYFGGMNLVSRYLSGETPEMYVSDTRSQDAENCGMTPMDEYLKKNLRSRYLNDQWIKGMMESGYSGGKLMAEFVNNLWGWEVCDPDLVDDSDWELVYETYINDPDMQEWFKENNPYAMQSIEARMLETMRKGYWENTEIRDQLVSEYVKSVVEDGVTCCHHTCGNPLLDEYVKGMMSVAGVSQELQDAYNNKITEATDFPETTPITSPSTSSSSGNRGSSTPVVKSANQTTVQETDAGYGTQTPDAPESSSSAESDPYVEGYEMQKDAADGSEGGSPMSFSGSDVVGTLFVLAAVGGIYLGFRKRKL
ncbi:CobN-like chelatase BtuS for metalloporphyrine salvage [Methanosarcina sp. MTP4]|nr:CobN-like chelatase BtuS for metalloporphyrine salvage [Methanosarcina sp. MTP4]